MIHPKDYLYYKTGDVGIFQNGDNSLFFYTANRNYGFQKNSMLLTLQVVSWQFHCFHQFLVLVANNSQHQDIFPAF